MISTGIFENITVEKAYWNFFLDIDYVLCVCQDYLSISELKKQRNVINAHNPSSIFIIGILDDVSCLSQLHGFSCTSLMSYEERWYRWRYPSADIQTIIIYLRRDFGSSKYSIK
jgi:hypothetical protein